MFWENPYRGAFPKPTTALVFELLKGGEPKFLHYITRDIRASGLDLIRALRGPLAEKFRNSKREIGIEFNIFWIRTTSVFSIARLHGLHHCCYSCFHVAVILTC